METINSIIEGRVLTKVLKEGANILISEDSESLIVRDVFETILITKEEMTCKVESSETKVVACFEFLYEILKLIKTNNYVKDFSELELNYRIEKRKEQEGEYVYINIDYIDRESSMIEYSILKLLKDEEEMTMYNQTIDIVSDDGYYAVELFKTSLSYV